MADNVTTTGYTTATDEIAGEHHQRVKIGLGADGSATDAVGGTGVDSAGVQRVSLATDVALPAGTNLLGKAGIDQTTPGTTNAVAPISGQAGVAGGTGVDGATVQRMSLATDVALPAGTNLLGKAGIDQTTPGTTNAVAPISGQAGVAGGTGVDGATVQRMTLATDIALPAGENQLGDVGQPGTVVDVTLSLDTSAYAAGDLLADAQEVASAVRENAGRATLESIQVLDEDDQGVAFDLLFLDAATSLGTENVAADISDANARGILGVVSIAAGDYVDLVSNQIATKLNVGLRLKAAAATTSIYVAAITRGGSPTYTASGIRLKLGFKWD